MATDSSQTEEAHRICGTSEKAALVSLFDQPFSRERGAADLCEFITVRKQDCQDQASPDQVLDLEGIDVRIMGWFVVVEH